MSGPITRMQFMHASDNQTLIAQFACVNTSPTVSVCMIIVMLCCTGACSHVSVANIRVRCTAGSVSATKGVQAEKQRAFRSRSLHCSSNVAKSSHACQLPRRHASQTARAKRTVRDQLGAPSTAQYTNTLQRQPPHSSRRQCVLLELDRGLMEVRPRHVRLRVCSICRCMVWLLAMCRQMRLQPRNRVHTRLCNRTFWHLHLVLTTCMNRARSKASGLQSVLCFYWGRARADHAHAYIGMVTGRTLNAQGHAYNVRTLVKLCTDLLAPL